MSKRKNAVTGLSTFENHDVLQSTIKVTNAGDGLSEAMSIDPVEIHLGEQRYLLIEAECSKVGYEELKDTGTYRRVQTLKAGTATLVDATFAAKAIQAQRAALDEARGTPQLPMTKDEVDATFEPEA